MDCEFQHDMKSEDIYWGLGMDTHTVEMFVTVLLYGYAQIPVLPTLIIDDIKTWRGGTLGQSHVAKWFRLVLKRVCFCCRCFIPDTPWRRTASHWLPAPAACSIYHPLWRHR